MRTNELYHVHTMALSKTGLNMKTFPTLKEFWGNSYEQEKKKREKMKVKRERKKNHFSVYDSHNYVWIKPIVSLKDSQIPIA